jgi:hypothetical protein
MHLATRVARLTSTYSRPPRRPLSFVPRLKSEKTENSTDWQLLSSHSGCRTFRPREAREPGSNDMNESGRHSRLFKRLLLFFYYYSLFLSSSKVQI